MKRFASILLVLIIILTMTGLLSAETQLNKEKLEMLARSREISDALTTNNNPELKAELLARGEVLASSTVVPTKISTTVEIGDGTIIDASLPIEPFYGYTYSQQIYLQSEINTSGEITEVLFHYNGYESWIDDSVEIYIGETTKSIFDSSTDWVPTTSMTLVFNGTFSVSGVDAWISFPLDTPFSYSNSNNLIIAVHEKTYDYHSDGSDFFCTWVGAARSIVAYDDYSNPDPTNPTMTGTVSTNVSNIRLLFGESTPTEGITSTTTGGNWNDTNTWIGGVVPTASDDVVIDGTVNVNVDCECHSLTVNSGKILQNLGYSNDLTVNGELTNNGTIRNNPAGYDFTVLLNGDLVNDGTITNFNIQFIGASDQTFTMDSNSKINGVKFNNTDSASSVIAGSDLHLSNVIFDFGDSGNQGKFILPYGSGFDLTLDSAASYTQNTKFIGNGNALYMNADAYMSSNTYLYDIQLKGTVQIESDYVFFADNNVIVVDTLQNEGYSDDLNILGNLTNYGVIRNNPDGYDFSFKLYGNLMNFGSIENYKCILSGSADQYISMDSQANFSGVNFTDPDSTSKVIASSNLVMTNTSFDFDDGVNQGELSLPTGSGFGLTLLGANSYTKNIKIAGGGNSFNMNDGAYLTNYTYLSDLEFHGVAQVDGDYVFVTGTGVSVEDTLQNLGYTDNLQVVGTLTNNGLIRNNPEGYDFEMDLLGNLINNGKIEDGNVYIKGSSDQTITLGNSYPVYASIYMYSVIGSGSYQWYKNSVAISGETSSNFNLDSLSTDEIGTYYCSSDAGNSRNIIIDGDGIETDDWTAQHITLYNTSEADLMARTGDVDNVGFGWPEGFDPFSGQSTPPHNYPWTANGTDADGTDRIMVISSYNGNPPAGSDGYTSGTSRPDNSVRPITVTYDLNGITVNSAALQIFVDDFQAPIWYADYEVTIDNVRAPFLESVINSLSQTGPIGKMISVNVPNDYLQYFSDGEIAIEFDDPTTGAGEGYAIDFVKVLINPTGFTYTGTITGVVQSAADASAIGGATVTAAGLIEATTNSSGEFTLTDVPAGLNYIEVKAESYNDTSITVDLESGATEDVLIEMTIAPAEYVTLTGTVTNATDASAVEGATVSVAGLSDVTDASGNYTIENVPFGSINAEFYGAPLAGDAPLTVQFVDNSVNDAQTVTATATGFSPYTNTHVVMNTAGTMTFDISLSPDLTEGNMRLVLNWDDDPRDLDSHLKTPVIESGTEHHVYYSNTGSSTTAPYAILDVDETEGYGPETITIHQFSTGTYQYYIYKYAGTSAITASNAVVQIYDVSGLLRTINVPTSGTGDYWHVCNVDGATQAITVINQIVDTEPGTAGKGSYMPEKEITPVLASKSASITSWNWDFGDGTSSTDQSPEHTYTAGGTYTVELTVSDGENSDTETKTDYITAVGSTPLVADFEADVTSGNAPLTVNFSNLSTGDIVRYSWDFDNDGTEDEDAPNPSHTFTEAGSYTVTLTIEGSDASEEAMTKEGYIFVIDPSAQSEGWEVLTSGTSSTLEMVCFPTENIGYAVGWDKTIIKTTDGGETWTSVMDNASYKYFYDVAFTNADTGVVCGSDGMIYKTTDGGQNWIDISLPVTYYAMFSVYFLDINTGYVAGNSGKRYKTTDGGANWVEQTAADNNIYDTFLAGSTAFQAGYEKIYTSSDNGDTWSLNYTLNTGDYAKAVTFTDENTGYVVGYSNDADPDEGFICITTDGGVNWTRSYMVSHEFDDIDFITPDVGFALGNIDLGDRIIYKTVNAGSDWIADTSFAYEYRLRGIDVAGSSAVFVVGSDGLIVRHKIGGGTAPELMADFEADVTAGEAPLTVNFSNLSTGDIVRFSWDFDNDGTEDSDVASPAYTFTEAGSYTVVLTVEGSDASEDVMTKTGYISVSDTIPTLESKWTWINPVVSNNSLWDAQFATSQIGYAVGTEGFLSKTVDGGENWKPIDTGETSDFYSVFFVDANTGYAGGSNGTFIKTTTGGASGAEVTSPFSYLIEGMWFFDADTGFVIGSNGNFAKTVDGGANWTTVSHPAGTTLLKDIFFVDRNTGFVVGGSYSSSSLLMKTTDGGDTWTSVSLPVTYQLNDIYFVNSSVGYAGGYSGKLVKTTDGGENWTEIGTSIYRQVHEVHFFDENTGVLACEYAIYYTADGGTTWLQKMYDGSMYANAMAFAAPATGYIFTAGGHILKSEDQGQTWALNNSVTMASLYELKFYDNMNGAAVGADGAVLFTSDGGNSWSVSETGTTDYLRDILYVGMNMIMASSNDGYIYYTTDNGASWTTYTTSSSKTLYGMCSPADQVLYACGYAGEVTKTVDGGTNWTSVNTGYDKYLEDVYFTDANTGFVVGGYYDVSKIFKTTDGGNTWTEIDAPVEERCRKIHFLDDTNGIIVGDDGMILKTNDGGVTWTDVSISSIYDFYDVAFKSMATKSSPVGYACGESGLLYVTYDGGNSWTEEEPPSDSYFYTTAFNGNDLFVGGMWGAIAKYAPEEITPVTVDFYADVTSGLAPLTVQFTSVTSGDIKSGEWDFGDESSSVEQNPSHTYTNAGVYTVTLSVTDSVTWATEIKTDYIVVMQPIDEYVYLNKGWNWFSIYVKPEDNTLSEVLTSIGDSASVIKGPENFALYDDTNGWTGALDTIDNKVMYMIKMDTSSTLKITGARVSSLETPIPLDEGWNWISYLSGDVTSPSTAFSGIEGSADFVKDQVSFSYYYEDLGWYGILNMMVPTGGYKLHMTASDVLTYLPFDTKKKTDTINKKDAQLALLEKFQINPADYTGSMAVTGVLSSDYEFTGEEAVVAYAGEELRGVASFETFPLNEKEIFMMLVYGNKEKESIQFKLVKEDGTMLELNNNIDFASDAMYGNGLEPLEMPFNTTGIFDREAIPLKFTLNQNFPNPFNPSTTIRYGLPETGNVRMIIYDLAGREVKELVNTTHNAGWYQTVWNGRDNSGRMISSGLYLCRIVMVSESKSQIKQMKMIFMK